MSTALIVGASRGIGHEFVRQYRSAGWRVIATARDGKALAELESAFGAEPLALDIAETADIDALADKLSGERLDVAIIVAGVYGPHTEGVEPFSADDFDYVMSTNVRGPMLLMPVLLPLVESVDGVLAVLSSRMGSIGEATGTTGWLYRASKAALNSALRVASLQTRRATCLALNPGWVRTDMGGSGAALTPERSVAGMREVIAEARAARSEFNGRFVQYDGTAVEW
ncbi:SDR family oxidoreductase [Trinickia caryophylli]|uniref:Short-chain dehydrogenase n=1 Tax=Trinickia caryophylli TaxID=28094 RepID=A0A1X7EMF8_TRICW|nr:SDR family oxidoreductase [Trinickia caryophylli]PMS10292.1 short chain dehydrogenase [Trinickia caryophylli]TRX18762.1 SDR family oxidoreductase [Trinickia caryophylli]WQE10442.1 SDR family oxidoreductase [Trinickia caryophylli]SMF36530.1 Short-chain dehydrogenase [Trinickia caryophylli]GLU32790.1 short-chain dehydrogenase/reductase [Trinickia caryophylli]